MGASQQYTNLYNESGYVYVTGISGTFPATGDEKRRWNYPDTGFPNFPECSQQIMQWALVNVPDNGDGYASFIIEVTAAAADNCTSVLVNGVAQTSGAIAMTVGDTAASAASIAAGINSYVPGAGPNYAATAVGSTIYVRSTTTGSGSNGDATSIAFSGASTATTTIVGGGRTLGEFPVRIWLDVSSSATESVMGVNAVEITDWLTHRGVESPRIGISASLVGNAVAFEREGNDMTVTLSGTAALNDILSIGVLNLDRITLQGDGATTQTLTASATIDLKGGSTYSISDETDKIVLVYDTAGTKWVEESRATLVDPALLRANGVAIPLETGVYEYTPAGSTQTIFPGVAGASGAGSIYEHDVTLIGGPVVLGASLNFVVDGTNGIVGDRGTISGNDVQITVGANAVNFSDATGVKTTLPADLAASGKWQVTWVYVIANSPPLPEVVFTVIPDFGTANTQFITTAMIKDANVTNAKILDATIVGSDKLVDASVTEAKLDALVVAKLNVQGRNRVTLSIPTAEVLTLFSVPVLAVPAPGIGFAVLVEQVTAQIAYAGVIYATNVNLQVKFTGAGEAVAESSSFLVKTANAIVNIPLMYTVGAAVNQILENTDLYVNVETGDPTAGTSDIWIYIDYSIISVQ
jgi:hypothetical protein